MSPTNAYSGSCCSTCRIAPFKPCGNRAGSEAGPERNPFDILSRRIESHKQAGRSRHVGTYGFRLYGRSITESRYTGFDTDVMA